MPLSVAPHHPIAFSFHKSLLFWVNFFQDDTLGVTRNWLCVSVLGDFRVVEIQTLKIVKCLLLSYLRVALYAVELQVCTATRSPCEDQALPLSWAPPSSAEGGKSSQEQPCCRLQWLRLSTFSAAGRLTEFFREPRHHQMPGRSWRTGMALRRWKARRP